MLHLFKDTDNSTCQAIIRNFHIEGIHTIASLLDRYALILANRCTADISNLTISNVSLGADLSLGTNMLFYSLFADMLLSDITILDSGTSGCAIKVQFGTLYLKDFRMESFSSASGFYFFSGFSTVYIQNAHFNRGISHAKDEGIFLYKSSY